MIGATRYVAQVEIQRQSNLAAEIAKLQQSISTNQRLTAASDDPKAAARIADIRQSQADNSVWLRNADVGTGIARAADGALTSLATAMTRARELIIAGANDTTGALDRVSIAAELRSIAGDVATLAQSRDPNGGALFPTGDAIAIPVTAGLGIAAASSAAQIFEGIPTDRGPQSIADILTTAASLLELPVDATVATTDATGNPVTLTRTQALAGSVGAIGAASDHVAAERTDQGLRAERFDDVKARLTSGNEDLTLERSGLADTDLTYAAAEFQAKSLALQAAQTVFAQSHKNSLFDLIG